MSDNAPIYSRTSETDIGNTTYVITVCNENAKETAAQKLFWIISNRISHELNRERGADSCVENNSIVLPVVG